MKRIVLSVGATLAVAGAFVLAFTATAHAAATVAPTDGSLLDLLTPVLDAFRNGSYLYAGSLALVIGVALVRRYAEPTYPWLGSKAGSASLALVGAFGASLAARLATEQVTSDIVWSSIQIAVGAAGGYAIIKALLIEPYLLKLADKGPTWLHAPMQWILWIFQETDKIPTASQIAIRAVAAVDRPDRDVTVAVTTSTGTAVASSPANTPHPMTVMSSDMTLQSSPAETISITRTPTK